MATRLEHYLLDEQPELSPYLLSDTAKDYSKGITPPPGNPAPIPASEPIPFKGMKDPTPEPTDKSKQK